MCVSCSKGNLGCLQKSPENENLDGQVAATGASLQSMSQLKVAYALCVFQAWTIFTAEGKQKETVETHSGNWTGPERGSAFQINERDLFPFSPLIHKFKHPPAKTTEDP